MVSLKELRKEAAACLSARGMCDFEADLALILMHVLNIDKTQLILGTRKISQDEYKTIHSSIKRLADGEPVSYITGCCEFMSLKFTTRPGVLIPRADTETLVEAVLQYLGSSEPCNIADICCGSGCIGISLAHYMPKAFVTALDISDTALRIASENAVLNNVSDRMSFEKTDILSDIPDGLYDCIVSNPPYIRSDIIETLDRKVRDFEPTIALDGGDDGLMFYKRISAVAPLKSSGLLAFETGYDQGSEVCKILEDNGYSDIELIKDLADNDRVVIGIKR